MQGWKVAALVGLATAVSGGQGAFAQTSDDATQAGAGDAAGAGSQTIVVTGQRAFAELDSALPVTVLSGETLAHRRQGGLGETLAGLPGVHLDNFGGGASRPVIRGQTVPRIEILSNGANLFDVSSVSPDHAITTEPLLLDAIEVLRGPAAAIYGGNAVNGAINLIDGKIPTAAPERGLSGATEARYGTGDEETTIVGRATAGVGAFAFHVEGFRRNSEDYAVPDEFGAGTLKDSFAESDGYSIGASWITAKGYVGAAYSRQDSEYGLPGHSHINALCHTHGLDLHCEEHGPYDNPFYDVPDSHTASINLRSERVDVRGDFDNPLPGFSNIRLRGSYTDYLHDEIDGPALFSRYTNEVYDGSIELTHSSLFGFIGTLGVQYTDGQFSGLNLSTLHRIPVDIDRNNPPAGYQYTDFVPPFYQNTENVGIYIRERRSFGDVDIEIAVRQDWRTITQPVPEFVIILPAARIALYERIFGPDWRQRLFGAAYIDTWPEDHPDAKHNPFSASIGATWKISDEYAAALSLARTERAPNMRELFAQGNNLATNSYELGLSRTHWGSSSLPAPTTDVQETTKSANLTFRKVGGTIEFEVGLFHQDVSDYIFARLIETEGETGLPHNYLVYVASDATFTGLDGQISHQINAASRVTVFGDYVRAELKNENDNLPRIPPGRLGARYEWTSGPLSTDIEYYRTFEQDRVAQYETRTSGYDMINATLAYRINGDAEKPFEIYLRGTNLTDELAFVHTSFVKNQSPLRGRNFVFGVRHQF